MGLSIGSQLVELVSAIAMGLGLGMIYDVFRVLRLHSGKVLGFIWDIMFCLIMASTLFSLGMKWGGIRFYSPLAAAGGAALHFVFFSKLWLGILLPLGRAWDALAARARNMGKTLIFQIKKILVFLKKIF